jgi:chaperonin GroES
MSIQPRNDVVVVKRLEEKYQGRLVLPEAHIEKPTLAVVVAVGPGLVNQRAMGISPSEPVRIPIDLKVGDIVFIGRYSGMEIEEKGEKLLFIREHEIQGKRV